LSQPISILVDTNVLLRSIQIQHAQSALATHSMAAMTARGMKLVLAAQSIYEFWVVATRPPQQNGLGLPIDTVHQIVTKLRAEFEILHDSASAMDRWLQLIVQHAVTGKPAHDARLAAVMQAHGIAQMLTFNVSDFRRYQDLKVWAPEAVVTDMK